MTKKQNKKGFTLIELLVVISIIGLLASVVLVALNGARKKARIVKRVADLRQIQKALELFYNDNGRYPSDTVAYEWRSQCAAWGSFSQDQVILDTTAPNGIPTLGVKQVVPTYMTRFPSDPLLDAAGNNYCYVVETPPGGKDYKIMFNSYGGVQEMTQAEWLSHPELVDPLRDGGPQSQNSGECVGNNDNTNISAWSVYSSSITQCW